jgi:CO/xanthine dehydrogenase FAD-binding subunit
VCDGVLRTAASRIGSRLIRNAVTVGGNIVQLYPWSDLPVALRVLDARVEVEASGRDARSVPIDTFLDGPPRRLLARGELVTALRLPRSSPGESAAFSKFARTVTDYTLASAAARVVLGTDGRCTHVRVAVGGVVPMARRVPEAEQVLEQQAPEAETLREAARTAAASIRYRNDFRASESYRRELVQVLVARVLDESVRRARTSEEQR